MYDAIEVARLVVNSCAEQGHPVTNLKLQKILYFMWLDWYRMKKKYLFDERIEAWHFGPTIPDVYRVFRVYVADPIRHTQESSIQGHDADVLKAIAYKYISIPVGELIFKSCEDGSPWDINGRDNQPFKEINKILMVDEASK